MKRSRIRLILAMVIAIAVSAAGLAVTALPASAWVYCDTVSEVTDTASGRIFYPTYQNTDPNCDMRINENGTVGQRAAITQLQESLNLCYGPNRVRNGSWAPPYTVTNQIDEDGEYGNNTRAAVRAVQRYHNSRYGAGLADDGYAGPKTRSKMIHETREGTFCTPPNLPIEIH